MESIFSKLSNLCLILYVVLSVILKNFRWSHIKWYRQYQRTSSDTEKYRSVWCQTHFYIAHCDKNSSSWHILSLVSQCVLSYLLQCCFNAHKQRVYRYMESVINKLSNLSLILYIVFSVILKFFLWSHQVISSVPVNSEPVLILKNIGQCDVKHMQ